MTKTLALAGAILVWIPLLAPLVFGAARLARGEPFMVDWLMPAELFPVALVGALMLWTAGRGRPARRAIGWGLVLAVAMLVGSQVLAVATGLADGRIEPAGWPWMLVLGMLAGYVVALIAIGVGGMLLVRDAFR